jgi:Sigma-70 region 2
MCIIENQLIALRSKMVIRALSLTRNKAAADDLTQDVPLKVLTARNTFTPGTNFAA